MIPDGCQLEFDGAGEPKPGTVATPSSLPTSYTFEYDAAQNLTRRTENRGCIDLVVDLPLDGSKRNRPGQVGERSLAWDANGNLVKKGDWDYVYDNRDRLVEVKENGSTIASYGYDALDRRTTRTVGGKTYRTVWDGWRPVEEYEDDVLLSRRIYGVGLDEIVRLEQNVAGQMKEYLPLYDSMGNVAMILDDQGVPIERYDYSPFGERAIQANDFLPPSVEQIRLVDGEIWVELSEPSVEDLLEVVEAGQLRLKNTTKNVDIVFDPEYGVEEGRQARRRLVLKPTNTTGEAPDLVEGNNLELVLESGVLVDSFGNASPAHTSDPFQWSATGDIMIIDTAVPELTEVCLVGNKLIVDFSEPVTTQAASTVLLIDGAQKVWTPVHEGYGVELVTALEEGSYTLSFGTDPLDLAAKPLAATPSIAFTTAETPVDAILHDAPYPGEVATSTIGNAFGFHGLPLDEETGLHYVRYRYYDPEMGRFTTRDPLGYVDGPSAYAFAMNSPVNYRDPLGLNSGRSDGKEVNLSDRALVVLANREEDRRRYCEALVASEDEVAEVDQENWTNTTGAGLVGVYDTQQRFVYKARIEQHRDSLRLALKLAEEGGDVARAFQVARVAVEGRNDLRTFSQLTLSPGGRALSVQLEKPRPFDKIFARYRADNHFATLREIVEASGRSNKAVLKVAKVSRVLAPTATVLGIAGSGIEIYNAPEDQRERVVFREAGSLAGGAVGGTAGLWAGVAGGGAALAAVGVANPPVGVIFGLALVGGGVGTYLGDGVGGWLGESLVPQYNCSDYAERN